MEHSGQRKGEEHAQREVEEAKIGLAAATNDQAGGAAEAPRQEVNQTHAGCAERVELLRKGASIVSRYKSLQAQWLEGDKFVGHIYHAVTTSPGLFNGAEAALLTIVINSLRDRWEKKIAACHEEGLALHKEFEEYMKSTKDLATQTPDMEKS